MARILLLLLTSIVAAACSGSPPASAAPTGGVLDGAERLISDLTVAGAVAVEAGSFDPSPLAGQAALLCIDGEKVRVYVYSSEQERAAAANLIDPTDPSNVGTAIIEWAGNPRFWQRDRILVLYLGREPATEALLTTALGPPFAQGLGRGADPRSSAC